VSIHHAQTVQPEFDTSGLNVPDLAVERCMQSGGSSLASNRMDWCSVFSCRNDLEKFTDELGGGPHEKPHAEIPVPQNMKQG